MARQIWEDEPTAAARQVYFHCVDATDGITAELAEVGGQPETSINGAAWVGAASIGVLVAIGFGRYYATLAAATVATGGDVIETRYKSAATAETVGDTVEVRRRTFETGMVYVDAAGAANVNYPTGTVPYPTDTIARGKTIADANQIDAIHLHGLLTFVAPMEHYNFVGSGHYDVAALVDLNGQSVEHSAFDHCILTGAMGNAAGVANATNCDGDTAYYGVTQINAALSRGTVSGACSILDGGWAVFDDCSFGGLGACTLTLNAPATCDIHNMRGTVTLAGMTGGVCVIGMQNGAHVTINATCVAGTITLRGNGTVTDNSAAGCTVNNETGTFGDLVGIMAAKLVMNAAATQVVFYDRDGNIIATRDWDAPTNTWNVTWP